MSVLTDYLEKHIPQTKEAVHAGFTDVTAHGVIGDGVTNNTAALRALIDTMPGGGILFFPPGRYVSGSLRLVSNMTLYLSTGAELVGSDEYADFPPLTEELVPGYTRNGRCALVWAYKARNIMITGGGVIDGQGQNWWSKVPRDHSRPRSIQPILCDTVRIRDITVKNSPSWTINPTCCANVLVDGVSIVNPYKSPNTDGINPESCYNVRIANCSVDVGDDCITLKSGTETDVLQKQFPCENITVVGCTLLHGHGGVVIGSEMSGGVRNVVVSGCVFNGTDRGVRIKSRRGRGGSVSGAVFSDLYMTDVLVPFTVNLFYRMIWEQATPDLFLPKPVMNTPVVEDITVANLTVRRAKVAAMYIIGLPEMPVRNLHVSGCTIETVVDPRVCTEAVMLPIKERLQGVGMRLDNVADSHFSDVRLSVANGPSLLTHNLTNVTFNGEMLSSESGV